MVTWTKSYLKQKYEKPGNVYLGVVSRLDKPVTGVLVFARTSKAAARLTKQFAKRDTRKIYWAIVEAPTEIADEGRIESWIRKNESQRRMELCRPNARDAQLAELNYRVLFRSRKQAWVEIELLTGRKHQIRVQFAGLGCPIVGDQKYGSSQPFRRGIALHASALTIKHPVSREPIEWSAELPTAWPPPPESIRGS